MQPTRIVPLSFLPPAPTVIGIFGFIHPRLYRHLPQERRLELRLRLNLIR